MTLFDAMLSFLSIFTTPMSFCLIGVVLLFYALVMFVILGPAASESRPYDDGWQLPLLAWASAAVATTLGTSLIIWALSSNSPFTWVTTQ